ncbi:DUF6286 domain-containing protein [Streptomyces sp. NBC_00237]|uniref:DUF6286 domain-containing protein n=1 Tax=Streptomyces sp. NBC_00237 TaxID=2975687 RepID=UPI002251EC46|nr:DUF6286 domain-containing protein [Streptomyces sp. NBC_00237]MCX5202047.1 DUF6286 domain-containing protein [Streptomyces sp. NBC_00237]
MPTLEAERASPVRGGPTARTRFWSARRIPAGLAAAALLGGSGLLLYDVLAVRSGRPGMRWRRELAAALAERPLGQVWVQVGAGLAVALGLWLVVLAVTPGLRSLLPMRWNESGDGEVRAGLHRGAASLVLRERAMEVPGVQAARVRVGRGRVTVRAVSHFRELADVREDVGEAMRRGVDELGLAHEPAVAVRVERAGAESGKG